MDDSIPPNTTFQSISVPASWVCNSPAPNGTGSVHCTNANLTVQSQNFSLVVKVNSGAAPGTTISNTATVSSDSPDSNSANNSSTTNTNVVAAGSAELAITKSDSPDPVGIGNDLTYTIVLTNHGPATAANLSVTDSLPSQVTFRSLGVPATWACITPSVGANGSITCTAPSLAPGSTATFPLVVNVNTSVTDGTIISNTANVRTTTIDSIASNDSATATTTAKVVNTISVTLFDSNGNPITTGIMIKLIQNGTVSGTTATSDGSGVYTFTGLTVTNGDRISTYISGASEKGTTATILGSTTADINNFNLNHSNPTITTHTGATTISNTNLFDLDSAHDADIPFTVSSGNVTTTAGTSVLIFASSNYAPGGNITVRGSWFNNGTFTAGSNTVTMNGAANRTVGGLNNSFFNNLTVNNTGTSPNNLVSLGVNTTAAVVNVNGGVFDQGASYNLVTNGSTTNVVIVLSGARWSNLGTACGTLSGGVAIAASINFKPTCTPC